jgi:thiosulfate/3-mercaptopyruvate sulfurtransferase
VKKTVLAIMAVLVMMTAAGCAKYDFAQTGQYIVTPKQAISLAKESAVLIDVRPADEYAAGHVEGAVNIPMSALVVNEPYANMLPQPGQVEQVMSSAGITENDALLVYDDASNMQAARVQWTLNMYGNFNVKVVSGGIKALTGADAELTEQATVLPEAAYKAGETQKTLIVNFDYIQMMFDKQEENTVIIDTRSSEEYAEGTIPGSVHIEYTWNNYASGQYKSAQDIQSTYIGKGILPDMKLLVFCKTSVRAAQTYTALKNAGYQDVRVYDGAWLEFSALGTPQTAPQTTAPSQQDAS